MVWKAGASPGLYIDPVGKETSFDQNCTSFELP